MTRLSSLVEWTSCAVVYTVSYGLSRSCTIANTIIHGHGTRASFFKSFKNHTWLSRIHSNGLSVTRIRPRLVRLYVRFTQVANRISRVFCVRQALKKSSFENIVGKGKKLVTSIFFFCLDVFYLYDL